MKPLEGKVVIITGGSRGIGKVVTKEFLNQGASVVICSRNENEIINTVKELDQSGTRLKGCVTDVTSINACKGLIKFAIQEFKKVDVLVNNAGIYGPIGPFDSNNLKEWHTAINVNLLGTINCSHEVIPFFKKQGYGKIVNMAGAGVGGKRALARFSSYYTSKAAVVAFTEVLGSELEEHNIQVNCIAPGAVNTFLTDFLLQRGREKAGEHMYQQALKQKETGGDPPELAATMITFLASEKADHITGKMLSAKWDKIDMLKKTKKFSPSLYALRRIDEELFYEK